MKARAGFALAIAIIAGVIALSFRSAKVAVKSEKHFEAQNRGQVHVSSAPQSQAALSVPSPVVSEPAPTVSHEEAKRYLHWIVNQGRPKSAVIPQLNFQPEDDATPQERAQIMAMRQTAAAKGQLLIAARSTDGKLHFDMSSSDFPRSFVPPNIRAALTEEDWEAFQVQLQVALMVNHGFGRSHVRGNESINTLEPTPASVTPTGDVPKPE